MINFIIKKQTLSLLFIFLFLGVLGLFSGVHAQEEVFDCKKSVSLVARDSFGEYIPNTSYVVYRQIEDVDGNPKPGKEIASGKTSEITGKGEFSFHDKDWSDYVIEMWVEGKGRFWFYGDLNLVCDSQDEKSEDVTEFLSSIRFVLRNTENELLKNHNFSIYTQRYDADNNPIKEKQDLVKTLNTSNEGEVVVYLPSSDRSLSGEDGGCYVFQTSSLDGGQYLVYDLCVSDGSENDFEYVLSDMKLNLKNVSGLSFPANTKIEMYKQEEDENNDYVVGEYCKEILTNDEGVALFSYPEGVYVARIKGADEKYQYFWDLEMEEGDRMEYDLTTQSSWSPGVGACEASSNLTVITKNIKGELISGLNFELYEQVENVNGVPSVGTKILSGKIDDYGKSVKVFNPNSLKKYALKIYDKNSKVGDFWFFDGWQFLCGQNKEIVKNIPSLSFVLRDGEGDLKKNHKFSVYTQKHDVDGNPIKEKQDLVVADLTTSEEGIATIYVSPDHPCDDDKKGTYVLVSKNENKKVFEEYYIYVESGEDKIVEYVFSDAILSVKDASGKFLKEKEVYLYEQSRDLNGNYALGEKLYTVKTDSNGQARIEYPSGRYAISIKDSLGKNNEFWNINIKNRQRTEIALVSNLTRVYFYDSAGQAKSKKTSVNIFDLQETSSNIFVKNEKIKTVSVGDGGYVEVMLKPGPYLFSINENKLEYGKSFYAQNNKVQEFKVKVSDSSRVLAGQTFYLEKPVQARALSKKLSGYILLQVEDHGEAWYVSPSDEKRYYMKDGDVAYEMMRRFGLGISNDDLKKIPIGIDDRFEDFDYDADMVPDKMEEALGTDMYSSDSDGDGYDDGVEVKNGFNPLGSGRSNGDFNFSEKLKGKIVLQVESKGEAWYVNPKDGRRYYMKDGDSAYEIMRFLSLGITNNDLDEIETGTMALN